MRFRVDVLGALHTSQPEVQITSAAQMFECITQLKDKPNQQMCIRFVATCYRVAKCAYEDLAAWQTSERYAQAVAGLQDDALWEHLEEVYELGNMDNFSSIETGSDGMHGTDPEEEGSELSEVCLPA